MLGELLKHKIHLINFDEKDKICEYLKEIGADIDLLEDETELRKKYIQTCDIAILNYCPDNELISKYTKYLHNEFAEKIVIFAVIEDINTLLPMFPRYEYLVKDQKFCDFNFQLLKKKLKCMKSDNDSSDNYLIPSLVEKIETYRTVLNSSPEAIIMLDENGLILGSNDYIEGMMIKKYDNYENRNIFELVSIGLASMLKLNIDKAAKIADEVDFIFRHHDYVTEYKIIPIIKENQPLKFILFTQNVTEKVYAERALRFNSELLNSIINNLPVTAWHINHKGILNLIAGKFPGQVLPISSIQIGSSIDEVLAKFPEFLNNIKNALDQKITYSIDNFGDNYIETYYSVVFDELGNVKGMIGLTNDITEKINAEVKLEVEKQKVRFAFQVSNDLFWELDLTKHLLLVNSLDIKTGSFSFPEKIQFDDFFLLLYPDDRPYIEKLFYSFSEGSSVFSEFHYRVRTESNEWIWLESKAGVFEYDEISGLPTKVVGVSRNVTDKIEIEREIQKSRNLLETIINSGDHYYLMLDKDYKVLAFNNIAFDNLLSFLNIYIQKGVDFGAYLKGTPASNEFVAAFNLALKGISSKYEFNYDQMVGADYWIEHFFEPIKSLEGDIYAVNIIAKPINDRKLIEKELEINREMLEAILDTSPIGIVLTQNNKIQWTNRYWRELMEYSPESAQNESFCDFCNHNILCNECLAMDSSQKFNDANGLELKLNTLGGNVIDSLVYAKYIREIGNKQEILLTVVDITERKKEELQREALLQANIIAEKKRNEAISLIENSARIASIGVIAGGITHEINQPLNAIRVASEGILFWNRNHNMALPDQVTRLINKISNATLKVDDIIQHMRAYWVESSKDSLAKVNLSESIQKALSLTLQRIQSHEVFLRIVEYREPLLVRANPLQLEIIINNLVINSLQAMEDAKIENKAITIRTGMSENKPFISIADNGAGLPDVPPESLFDPFFSTKKDDKGTGLGLAIVKLFVSRFGAEIIPSNNEEGGACFTIYFESFVD